MDPPVDVALVPVTPPAAQPAPASSSSTASASDSTSASASASAPSSTAPSSSPASSPDPSLSIDPDDDSSPATSSSEVDSQLQQPSGGVLLGWGCGMYGLLGSSDESNRPAPVRLPNFSALVTSVNVGSAHALACGSDGTLYSWGNNDNGELGLGDTQARHTPTELASLATRQIVSAAAGYAHSFVLSRGGEALAFGSGEMATLGLTVRKRPAGTPPDLSAHFKPALVRELAHITRIIQVACGDTHTLALSTSGRVYSVGDGSRGSLGLDFAKSTHIKGGAPATEGSGVRVAVFTEVSSLLPAPISSIAAGAHHSLFVSASGSVYSCGDSTKGRLGYPTSSTPNTTVQWLPRRITGALDNKFVMSASAGSQYSLFLTQQYAVYATGSNRHGEAGVNGSVISQLDSPALVPGLPAILQISAGSTHALARDAWNRVWSWGSGEFGELGRGEAAPLVNSTEVGMVALPKVFPHQHVVCVAAGSNVSYVVVGQTTITATVGKGPQSPHRMVPSCGEAPSANTPATYALCTSVGTDYMQIDSAPSADADGVAAAAAASSSSSSSVTLSEPLSPQYIVRPSVSPLSLNAFSYTHFAGLLRRKDYAALGQYIQYVFSSALILNASFLPKPSVGGGSHIDHSLLELVYAKIVKSFAHAPKLQVVLSSSIQKTVSSMVALMKQTGRQPPRDLAAYRAVFIVLQSPHLLHGGMAETAVLTDISYVLTRMPREVAEKVTSYLWMQVPMELLRTRFIRTILKNIERRMQQSLHGMPIQARLRQSSDEVRDLVYILNGIHQSVTQRQASQKLLHGRHHGHGLLLEGGMDESGRSSPDSTLMPETAWHLPLDRYMDLGQDLANYLQATPTASQMPVFSFMRFPFLLSPATKAQYMRVEFDHLMQQQALGAMLFSQDPMLKLNIRRTHIVEDAVNAINRHSVYELRKPLKVQFSSNGEVELGEDQGGVSAEFFELVFKHLLQPQYALWEARPEWKSVWFSSLPIDPSKASLYQVFGTLLGMLLYNGSSVNLNFPLAFYAQLLGIQPTLQHLHSADPQLADSLQEVLDFEGDIENTFCLTFSVDVQERSDTQLQQLQLQASRATSGLLMSSDSSASDDSAMQVDDSASAGAADASSSSTALVVSGSPLASADQQQLVPAPPRTRFRNVPLLPGGEDIVVTQANKAAYVAAYLKWLFHDSCAEAIGPLIEGFQSIVSEKGTVSMKLFSPADLELVTCGTKTLDFADLRRGTRYEGYTSASPIIRNFWEIVLGGESDPLALTPKEQKQLLLFSTGSSRAPVGGLSDVNLLIQRAGPDSEALPTSSTCFHALLIPEYDTKAKLSHKLKIALANAIGFGLR